MPILNQDVDQTIQQALKERFAQIFTPNVALDPLETRIKSVGTKVWKETARRYAAYFWAAPAGILAGALGAPLLVPFNEALPALFFLITTGAGIGLAIRGFKKAQQELSRFASADVMRTAGKLVALSRAEAQYCGAIAVLIDAEAFLPAAARDELLQQLNDLLASCRRLDEPVRQFGATTGDMSLEQLEQELAVLTERRDSHQDAAARDMMEQSIALCAQRLDAARAWIPAREQAEAQQELIIQTLASVQGSLARLRTAGAVTTEADTYTLRDTVSRAHSQARAVEEAVAELKAVTG